MATVSPQFVWMPVDMISVVACAQNIIHGSQLSWVTLISRERRLLTTSTPLRKLFCCRVSVVSSEIASMESNPKICGQILNLSGDIQSRHVRKHEVKLPFAPIEAFELLFACIRRWRLQQQLHGQLYTKKTPLIILQTFNLFEMPWKKETTI